MYKTVVFTVRL